MDNNVNHRMSIANLLCTYLVPQDHPAPEKLRGELDDVVRKHIADSCGRALSTLLDPRDPSVWLIDRVSVDVLMDLSAAAPEAVAAFWGAKIAESVAGTIARGEDGGPVMRFANRAEYLAYFVRDLAAGTAWGKWHYSQFESLRSLPTGSAIREAMLREPDQAEPALVHLVKTNRIGEVAPVLTQLDQERLVQLCSPEEVTPGRKSFEAVLRAWAAAPSRLRRSLDLYLRARYEHPEFPAAEVRAAVRHALAVARWHQNSRLEGIAAALAANRLSLVIDRLPPPEQETALYLGFLSSEDSAWPGRLVEIVRQQPAFADAKAKESPAPQDQESVLCFTSPWAGVFLLLPTLIANRELIAAYGTAGDECLRYLLLSACLPANSADAQSDAALGLAAGLDAAPESWLLEQAKLRTSLAGDHGLLPGDLEHIQSAVATLWFASGLEPSLRGELELAAAVLLRGFARTLPGLGRSRIDYLWRNILSGEGTITAEPSRILVALAPRPLEIVLRMAGLHELRLAPPWKPETEVVVRFDRQ
jgi:hypothetical protein